MSRVLTASLFCLLFSCTEQSVKQEKEERAPSFVEIPVPGSEGSAPNIFISHDQQAYLSWVEYLSDSTDALWYSKLQGGSWGKPVEVARGGNWFVNWADFPSMAVFGDGGEKLAAHWLQKSAEGTYDYDVRVSVSDDGGAKWQPSFVPHTDGLAAEHGFVSMLPVENGRIAAVWLDGRNTKHGKGHEQGHGHGGAGAMTLRTAEFDPKGKLYEEAELDGRICDCCQTDAALAAAGPVVVYRDRSEKEIRDISIVRKVNGTWTAPKTIHADNWEITGCPVNGPAIAAEGNRVAVAWFTGAGDEKKVNVAFSQDGGDTFKAPVRVDDGNPVGRVDIVFSDPETALVSWLETTEAGGEVRLAKVSLTGKLGKSITATSIRTSRQSGFPILEKLGERYLLAWTHTGEESKVKSLLFTL